jgi:hypothetical protein
MPSAFGAESNGDTAARGGGWVCDPLIPVQPAATDDASLDLGAWDVPWPLEPAIDRLREPSRGPQGFDVVMLYLAGLIVLVLLAARLAGIAL